MLVKTEKIFPFLFLLLMLAVGFSYAQQGNTCSGQTAIDYYNKGTISGTYQGSPFSFTDACVNDKLLQEYYCPGDNTPSSTFKLCSAGCVDGACLGCTAGVDRRCSDDGKRVEACNQHGTDWVTLMNCEHGCLNGVCVDSAVDIVSIQPINQSKPVNKSIPANLTECTPGEEECITENQLERCKKDGSGWEQVDCEYGCFDGRCVACVEKGESKSKDFFDFFGNICCGNLELCFHTTNSSGVGTCLEECLEQEEDGSDIKHKEQAFCANHADCKPGEFCIAGEGKCVPNNQRYCFDSDGGENTVIKGYVEGVQWILFGGWHYFKEHDDCNWQGRIKEWYCKSNDKKHYKNIKCDSGFSCKEGVCVNASGSSLSPPHEPGPQPPAQPPGQTTCNCVFGAVVSDKCGSGYTANCGGALGFGCVCEEAQEEKKDDEDEEDDKDEILCELKDCPPAEPGYTFVGWSVVHNNKLIDSDGTQQPSQEGETYIHSCSLVIDGKTVSDAIKSCVYEPSDEENCLGVSFTDYTEEQHSITILDGASSPICKNGDVYLAFCEGGEVSYERSHPCGQDCWFLGGSKVYCDPCFEDSDCGQNQECIEFQCVDPECNIAQDCWLKGFNYCVGGKCVDCTNNEHCSNGLVCDGGHCVEADEEDDPDHCVPQPCGQVCSAPGACGIIDVGCDEFCDCGPCPGEPDPECTSGSCIGNVWYDCIDGTLIDTGSPCGFA